MSQEHVALQADAMAAIEEAIKPFPVAEQMVIVSGVLGNVLARCGERPSKISAIAFMGMAFDMTRDMIQRHYDDEADVADAALSKAKGGET